MFPTGKDAHKPVRHALRILNAVVGPKETAQIFSDYIKTRPPRATPIRELMRDWIDAADSAEEAGILTRIFLHETELENRRKFGVSPLAVSPPVVVFAVAQDWFAALPSVSQQARAVIALEIMLYAKKTDIGYLKMENSPLIKKLRDFIETIESELPHYLAASTPLANLLQLILSKDVEIPLNIRVDLSRRLLHAIARSGAANVPEELAMQIRLLRPPLQLRNEFGGVNALDSLLNRAGTNREQQIQFLTHPDNQPMLDWLLGSWLREQLTSILERAAGQPDLPLSQHLSDWFKRIPLQNVPTEFLATVTLVALQTASWTSDHLPAWTALNAASADELKDLYSRLPAFPCMATEFKAFLQRQIFSRMNLHLEALNGEQFRCAVETLPPGPWQTANFADLLKYFEEAYPDIPNGPVFLPDCCRPLQLARAELKKATQVTPELVNAIHRAATENHHLFAEVTVTDLADPAERADENLAMLSRWKTDMASQVPALGSEWVNTTIARVETAIKEGYEALREELNQFRSDQPQADLDTFKTFVDAWLTRLDQLYQQLYPRTGLLRMVQYTQNRTPYRGAPSAENKRPAFEAWYKDIENRMRFLVYTLSASQMSDPAERGLALRNVLSELAIQGKVACGTGWTDALQRHTSTRGPVEETFQHQLWAWVHQYLTAKIDTPEWRLCTYNQFMALIQADLKTRIDSLTQLQEQIAAADRLLKSMPSTEDAYTPLIAYKEKLTNTHTAQERRSKYLREQYEIIYINLKQPAHMVPFLNNLLLTWLGIPAVDDDAVLYQVPGTDHEDTDRVYTSASQNAYCQLITHQTATMLSELMEALTKPEPPFTTLGVTDTLKGTFDERTMSYNPLHVLEILTRTGSTTTPFVNIQDTTLQNVIKLQQLYTALFGQQKSAPVLPACC